MTLPSTYTELADAAAELRLAMLPNSCYVPADADAATNVTNINTALAAYSQVILSGTYDLNDTIVIPNTSALLGMPMALLNFTGAVSATKYAVTIAGPGTAKAYPPIANILVYCQRRCRGVFWSNWFYGDLYNNLIIHSPQQIGADLISCWASCGRNLSIRDGRGIALRMHQCNSMSLDTVVIGPHSCFWNSDPDDDVTTWATACDDGQAAAEALDGYTVDWPAEDDTSVVDYSEDPVQTAAGQRAAIIATDQDLTEIRNLCTEGVRVGDFPLMYLEAGTILVSTMRTEGNYHGDAIVKLVGDGGVDGSTVQFTNIKIDSTKHAATFLDLTGTTRNVSISFLEHHAYQLSASVIRLTSGIHYNPTVTNCRTVGLDVSDHIDNVGATYTPTLSFFNKDLVIQPTVATDATVATLITALTNLGLIKNA